VHIHEYQAKALLSTYGVPVLKGIIAYTADEAFVAAKSIDTKLWIVKAQIHSGGRGKAGEIILAKSPDEVKQATEKLLGKHLITHQTDANGQEVKRVYIEEGCSIARELYLGFVLDRDSECVSLIASGMGGTEIEIVAKEHPEAILTMPICPISGFQDSQKLGDFLKLDENQSKQLEQIAKDIYRAFIETDASLIEINPLAVTQGNALIALDAKITFDDSALFRHPEIEALRDEDEENPIEMKARHYGLSYVKLDGNIGCMVNGAGLAMATMDIIKLYGCAPANFLDVGGGANQQMVETAFKLILADPNVKAILINIFGGIMHCDVIANGIVAAAKEVKLSVPMVVRLQGTNEALGRKIIQESGLAIIPANDLEQAAIRITQEVLK
jgi:succinyl-CoA synthetase beta subunit